MDTDDKETEPRIEVARSLGRVGYEAYAATTGGKTFDGRDMPAWTDLPERIVNAWESAALAIVDQAVMVRVTVDGGTGFAPTCCSPEKPHVLKRGDPLPAAEGAGAHHIEQLADEPRT